jgi:DNA polymerase theta
MPANEVSSIEEIGTIVIDELHMIGEQSRGYLLEVTLSKIRFLMSQKPPSSI